MNAAVKKVVVIGIPLIIAISIIRFVFDLSFTHCSVCDYRVTFKWSLDCSNVCPNEGTIGRNEIITAEHEFDPPLTTNQKILYFLLD